MHTVNADLEARTTSEQQLTATVSASKVRATKINRRAEGLKFDKSAAVSDQGVAAVGVQINKLGWVFRELAKRDLGIDAQVEVCDGELSTSKLIALQIKSGESFFKERTAGGVVFRDTPEHLEYFLEHSLPVLIVLYDPRSGRAHWQHVTEGTAHRTPKGWSLLIPDDQEIGADSADELRHIAVSLSPRARNALPRLKPWYKTDGELFPMHDILHAASRTLLFVSPFVSREFLAILDFVAAKVAVRGIVGSSEIAFEVSSQLPPTSRLELRTPGNQGGRLHAKILIVDDKAACFGSANLTWGSARNHEVMHCMTNPRSIRREQHAFEDLWRDAIPVALGHSSGDE